MDSLEGCNKWSSYKGQDYDNEARALSKMIHRIPHIDFTLQHVNSTFAPKSKPYLQSLGVHACFSVAWLISTLMLLFGYFILKTLTNKKAPLSWMNNRKRILNGLAATGLVITFFGILSNVITYFALARFLDEIYNIHLIVKSVNKEVRVIKRAVLNTYKGYQAGVAYFMDIKASGLFLNYDDETITRNVERRILALKRMWGWMGVWTGVGVAGWGVAASLCIAVSLTLSSRTKFARLLLSIYLPPLGSLSAVSCGWLAAGALTALSVALADACQRPGLAVAGIVPFRVASQDVLYYTECVEQDNSIASSRDALLMIKRSLVLLRENLEYLTANQTRERYDEIRLAFKERAETIMADLWPAEVALFELNIVTECESTRKYFMSAVTSICSVTLKGILLELASVTLLALLFTAVLMTYISTK